jgi:putative heme transporter
VNDAMSDEQAPVPRALRTAAAWSWRILVVLLLAAAVVALIVRLELLFVAVFVALLGTALLEPGAARLRRWGLPPALATAGVLLAALALVVGLLYLAGRSLVKQVDMLVAAVVDGVEQVLEWAQSTFGLDLDRLAESLGDLTSNLGEEGGSLASSAFGVASTAAEVVAGAGISLFAIIFFVHDGPGIWRWVTSLFPTTARGHVDEAGRLSWQTLAAYARGTVVIAAIDAVGIGVGAALIGVPLAGAIGVLVFFGAFIPIVGALLSGAVAVLIALAIQGLTGALLMLAIVIGVQQFEGNVLQPLIQGRFVAIHPLAVVLAVAGGTVLAGIIGAVIAVPVVAVANVIIRYAAGQGRGSDPGASDLPDAIDAADEPVGGSGGTQPAAEG